MSDNLSNFNNIYANLSQSAYPDTPKSFVADVPGEQLNKPIDFNYSQTHTHTYVDGKGKTHTHTTQGGQVLVGPPTPDYQGLSKGGVVYLQPDPTLKTHFNGMGPYEKGDLTDSNAGFNAYFVTDTPQLDGQTRNAYLTIRGSDGMGLGTLNDWVINDAYFAFFDGHMSQGQLATTAMQTTIARLNQEAPNAVLNLTGHSLGTMATVQGMAGLSSEDLAKIGQVVLFNGPDVRKSLVKMGLSDSEIEEISKKLIYYVNPFDIVSMLHRTDLGEPSSKQLGTVHVVVPLHFTSSFDNPSSHMFGGLQIGPDGQPLVASSTYHPYLIEAGKKLAQIEEKYIDLLMKKGVARNLAILALFGVPGILTSLGIGMEIYEQFSKEYEGIIEDTREESIKWIRGNISSFQQKIKNPGPGDDPIVLRAQLLYMATQLATLEVEDQVTQVGKLLDTSRDNVQTILGKAKLSIELTAQYLPHAEVMSFLYQCELNDFWSVEVEEGTRKVATEFKDKVTNIAELLNESAKNLTELDQDGTKLFEDLQDRYL